MLPRVPSYPVVPDTEYNNNIIEYCNVKCLNIFPLELSTIPWKYAVHPYLRERIPRMSTRKFKDTGGKAPLGTHVWEALWADMHMEQQCRRPLTDRVGPDRKSPSGAAGGFLCHLVMFIPLILVIITFNSQRKSWERMQLSVGDLVCHNRTLGHWEKKIRKSIYPIQAIHV